MPPSSIKVSPVQTQVDLHLIKTLFQAYATSLNIDLTFQNFAAELASLPGNYAPPTGVLLLAKQDDKALGCVGLRPFPQKSGYCEMKRLYVDPSGRGLGVGRALAEAVITEAKRRGYRAILLDTLTSMTAARALYGELGFVEVERYYDTPIEETTFLKLDL